MIYPCPKPTPTEPKPKKPIRKRRARVRPGRLKGDALGELRRLCFDRDGGRCVDCGRVLRFERGYSDSMEMAHVRGKRMWGDSLSNVRAKCGPFAGGCHAKEHQYGKSGLKPVPSKR